MTNQEELQLVNDVRLSKVLQQTLVDSEKAQHAYENSPIS